MALLSFTVLGCISIAGCVEESGAPEPLDAGTPTADSFDWTSCLGLGMGVDMVTPLYDAERPDGWSASQDNSAVDGILGYTLLKCDRVSWGPFERGPIFIMQEWHNDFETPGKCAEGDFTRGMILRLAWFSDPDLAEYAHEEFGMPAQVATIAYNFSTTAGIQFAHWTWSLPGGNVSEVTYRTDDAFLATSEPDWRVFWDNGVGVSYVDFRESYTTPQESFGEANGTLAPPMLYGEAMPDDRFVTVDQTDQMLEARAHGDISRFSDSQCEKPV